MSAPAVHRVIHRERERLRADIAREELRVNDHRSKIRPLELHIAELRAELAALTEDDGSTVDHHEGD